MGANLSIDATQGNNTNGFYSPGKSTRRKKSINNEVDLSEYDKLLSPATSENTMAPSSHSLEDINGKSESLPGSTQNIAALGRAGLLDPTKTFRPEFTQTHEALMLSMDVIEDVTNKLYKEFEEDIDRGAFKQEDIKKDTDAKFNLFNEISDFQKTFFPELKNTVDGLEAKLTKEDAFAALNKFKTELNIRKARIVKNLPSPQSKLFKVAHYFLEGLNTVIILIVMAIATLGLTSISTTVPCAIAALICLFVKAWTDHTTLPEDNKNTYIKRLDDLYQRTLSAIAETEEDVGYFDLIEVVRALKQENQMLNQAIVEKLNKNVDETTKRLSDHTQTQNQNLVADALKSLSADELISILKHQNPAALSFQSAQDLEILLQQRKLLLQQGKVDTPSSSVSRADPATTEATA